LDFVYEFLMTKALHAELTYVAQILTWTRTRTRIRQKHV